MANFLAGNGAVWAQPQGPNTVPVYLGCHEVADIENIRGEAIPLYYPDPATANRFIPSLIYQGEPSGVLTRITAELQSLSDWIELIPTSFPLYIAEVSSGRKDLFTNYSRMVILDRAIITSDYKLNLTAKSPSMQKESLQSFDVTALKKYDVVRGDISRVLQISGRVVTGIDFAGPEKTVDHACFHGYAGLLADGANSTVYKSIDAGLNWTAVTIPFGVNDDVGSIAAFQITPYIRRIIACRTSTIIGTPAQIALSDDEGVTWTIVDLGISNDEYVAPDGNSIFVLNDSDIWIITKSARIYHSVDQGLTWTVQAHMSGATRVIQFVNSKYGFVGGTGSHLYKTVDGGYTWTAISTPTAEAGKTILALYAVNSTDVWVGYDGGSLYYTNNAGITWYERLYPGSTEIQSIDFSNPYVGFMACHTATGGLLFRTVDGGFNWEALTMPLNTNNLYRVITPHSNLAYTVG